MAWALDSRARCTHAGGAAVGASIRVRRRGWPAPGRVWLHSAVDGQYAFAVRAWEVAANFRCFDAAGWWRRSHAPAPLVATRCPRRSGALTAYGGVTARARSVRGE